MQYVEINNRGMYVTNKTYKRIKPKLIKGHWGKGKSSINSKYKSNKVKKLE